MTSPAHRGSLLVDACTFGKVELVHQLLDEGVPVFAADDTGHTGLHKAALMDFPEVAKILIKYEPSIVDIPDANFRTALHQAAWGGMLETTRILVASGANLDAADLAGNTPLHCATLNGYLPVMRILLDHGANPNCMGPENCTPLHFAVITVMPTLQLALAELLLAHGASLTIRNRDDRDPGAMARYKGMDQMARFLALRAGTGDAAAPIPTPRQDEDQEEQELNDDFLFILSSLQSSSLRRVIDAFHATHHHKFRRNAGGDFPLELTALHTHYAGLVSQALERKLSPRGLSLDSAARACQRAALEGRCSALRLQVLQQLAALTDFLSFFEFMTTAPQATDHGLQLEDVEADAREEASTQASATAVNEADTVAGPVDGLCTWCCDRWKCGARSRVVAL